MKILVAPDSFKGSISATRFCHIAARTIQQLKPDTKIHLLPLADGGEGTISAICSYSQAKTHRLKVKNPIGKSIYANYAILKKNQTAIIEMAQASGLNLLNKQQQNPLLCSSYGTGELIKAALDKDCRKFIIGLGGSATNDAGMGMLAALGVNFYDLQQQKIVASGQNLSHIDSIDLLPFDPRIKQSKFIIAADVTNPLLGKLGATYTYGPQKGADKQMLVKLESAMQHFANKSATLFHNKDSIHAIGAGAAGGMAYSLMTYFNASMKSGFEIIADLAKLDIILSEKESKPDMIITGEGRFDSQSLQGKVVGRLIVRAENKKIPILVLCGSIGDDIDIASLSANSRIISLCQGSINKTYALKHTEKLVAKRLQESYKDFIKNIAW